MKVKLCKYCQYPIFKYPMKNRTQLLLKHGALCMCKVKSVIPTKTHYMLLKTTNIILLDAISDYINTREYKTDGWIVTSHKKDILEGLENE